MAGSEGGLRWGLLTLAVKSGFESPTCRRPGARGRPVEGVLHPRGQATREAISVHCRLQSRVLRKDPVSNAKSFSHLGPQCPWLLRPDNSQAPGGWNCHLLPHLRLDLCKRPQGAQDLLWTRNAGPHEASSLWDLGKGPWPLPSPGLCLEREPIWE